MGKWLTICFRTRRLRVEISFQSIQMSWQSIRSNDINGVCWICFDTSISYDKYTTVNLIHVFNQIWRHSWELLTSWNSARDLLWLAEAIVFMASMLGSVYRKANFPFKIDCTSSGLENKKLCENTSANSDR